MDKRSEINIFIFLFLFAFVLEFLLSINSYTHDLYCRIDNAIYFMCGKAWMNGLTPYVDFSDSKGPLLMLIYGIGYLFSNYNYIGVFWIECIFYTFTFFYSYKIIFLFLANKKIALLGSMLMSLSFFCSAYHYETQCEDYCQPFIVAGLYYILRAIYKLKGDKDIKVASFVVGLGFAVALLIKFTIAAMILILFFVLFFFLIKSRRYLIWKSFLYLFIGIFLVLIPFFLYFLYKGSFTAFINEYFISTTQTVVKTPTLGGMIKDYIWGGWGSIFRLHPIKTVVVCFLLLNIILGCIFFYKKLSAFKLFPTIIALWFIGISMYHALGYYYLGFAAFAIFPVIMYLTFFRRFIEKRLNLIVYAIVIIVISATGNLLFFRPNFFLNKNKEQTDFYYVNYIMSQVPNPKIIYSFYDTGYGISARALPACKYWFEQYGATEKMILEREIAIKQQIPDFAIVMPGFKKSDYNFLLLLQQSGYVKYYTWMTQEGTHFYESQLYGKSSIPIPPPKDFRITPIDILFKKRIIERERD